MENPNKYIYNTIQIQPLKLYISKQQNLTYQSVLDVFHYISSCIILYIQSTPAPPLKNSFQDYINPGTLHRFFSFTEIAITYKICILIINGNRYFNTINISEIIHNFFFLFFYSQTSLKIFLLHYTICAFVISALFYQTANNGSEFTAQLKLCITLVLFHGYSQQMAPVVYCEQQS